MDWKNSPYRKPLILKGVRQVGKVNFIQIDPMTFSEFLIANGDENLAAYLESVDAFEPIPDAFFNPLYEKLKMYYVTGGMPDLFTKSTAAPLRACLCPLTMTSPPSKFIW